MADAPDQLAANVNRWLAAPPARKLVRTLDAAARALLSDSYRPLDNFDPAEAVLPTLLGVEAEVISCDVTDTRFYLKAVTRRVEGEVKLGDLIRAGLVASNSELGHGALRVEALDYRLVCTNGMIREGGRRDGPRLALTDGEKGSVLQHLIRGGDLSGWGLANAVTRTAEDAADYDRATELEAAGGRVIELAPTHWQALAA